MNNDDLNPERDPDQLDLFEMPAQGTGSRVSGARESQTIATAKHGHTAKIANLGQGGHVKGLIDPLTQAKAPSERPSLEAVAMGAVAPVHDAGLPDDSDWLERPMAMMHEQPDPLEESPAFCRRCGKVEGTLAKSADGETIEVRLKQFGRGRSCESLCSVTCFSRATAARRRERRDGRSVPA